MSLLELYKEKNKDAKWKEKVLGINKNLYLYDFTINFRNLLYFEDGFKTYCKICEMNKDQLEEYTKANSGQAKSFMANMNRTKLFMTRDSKRTLSSKGEVYEKFLSEKLSLDDRWFINYLFIIDSCFSLKSNYIFNQTDSVFEKWLKAGYTLGQLYNMLMYFFNIKQENMEEYLQTEYLILLFFMDDTPFLSEYRESSEFEKSELHEYIIDNYNKKRFNCIVSEKFSPNSLTDCDTILDDAKILFFSHYLANSHPISLEDMLDIFMQVYTRFYKLNTKKVTNFIMMYQEIFRMTFLNLFSDMQDFYSNLKIDDPTLSNTYERMDEQTLEEILHNNLDYSTTESINALVKINSMFSSKAKQDNDYKCELHSENGCKYFIGKNSNRPYLEIHQLIPRDFSNEFSSTIERVSNYIPLCPQCHRLVHNATDEEKYQLLSAIYKKRKLRLESDGIYASNDLLLAIYGIEQVALMHGANDFDKPLLTEAQPKLSQGKTKKTAVKKTVEKTAAQSKPKSAAKSKKTTN